MAAFTGFGTSRGGLETKLGWLSMKLSTDRLVWIWMLVVAVSQGSSVPER